MASGECVEYVDVPDMEGPGMETVPTIGQEHNYLFRNYCGVQVCGRCGDHRGLARCYCGWSAGGGDGRGELIEMGETIDDDY